MHAKFSATCNDACDPTQERSELLVDKLPKMEKLCGPPARPFCVAPVDFLATTTDCRTNEMYVYSVRTTVGQLLLGYYAESITVTSDLLV